MLAIMRLSEDVWRRTFVRSSGWVTDAAMDAAIPECQLRMARKQLTSEPDGVLLRRDSDGLDVLCSTHGLECMSGGGGGSDDDDGDDGRVYDREVEVKWKSVDERLSGGISMTCKQIPRRRLLVYISWLHGGPTFPSIHPSVRHTRHSPHASPPSPPSPTVPVAPFHRAAERPSAPSPR
jgi:hypothetical protein